MFSLFDDQFVVSRAEQSRVSYNLQTEEFRNLNANLQIYLGDIKTIDDDNHQLQEKIDQLRVKYISTLENHLQRLPNDFRVESEILTNAHLERYKFKSRTRRFVLEREEFKRRIHFVATNEKDQGKYLNNLQKQEHFLRKEFLKFNEQFQRLNKYVANEKEIYQQAMNKVDDLQIQLEQICIERSKTEFEIQTLKEEVKLMQTTKEFLDEERETILSTQTEANEYFLSRLNDSITRIRDDFDQLNQTQLQQIENEYKQMLQTFEENLLTNQTINTSQQTIPSEYDQLQNEYQTVSHELTTLNNQNQNLSKQILAMENDLYSLRNERMQQLLLKDNELEYSKIQLQALNEKLNHLAEYDRNLKFELTLYRGVLESEYKRKQATNNMPQLIRPTTLRTNKNSITDRTTWLTSNTYQNKFNDQQQEEILTTRNRVQSEYDPLGDGTNSQINDVLSTKTPSIEEHFISGETLWQQLIDPFNQNQQQDEINANIITQGTEKPSSSLFSTTISTENQSTSPFEAQQSSSRTSSISTGTPKSSNTPSTPAIFRDDQLASSQVLQLSTTSSERRSLPTVPPSNQTTSPANTTSPVFEVRQSPSASPQEYQTLSEVQQASSRTSSISTGTSAETQKLPSSSIVPIVSGDQLTSATPEEHQPSSRTSSISFRSPSDIQKSPLSPTTSTNPGFQPPTSDIRQTPSTPPQEHQPSSRTSSISSKTASDIQKSPLVTTPVSPGYQLPASDVHQTPLIDLEEHQLSSRSSSITAGTLSDVQKSPSSSIVPIVSGDQLTSAPPEEHQPSSRTSSISSRSPSDIQKSPLSPTTSTNPEFQPPTSDIRQTPSTPPQEHQPSSRTSSISSKTASDIQKSPLVTTPVSPGYQLSASDVHQTPLIDLDEHESSSRTSSISAKTPSEDQKSPLSATTPTVPEYQPSSSDVHQSPTTPLQEHQPPSGTSSISAETPSDIQTSSPTIPQYQSLTSDVHQSPWTLLEDLQTLSEVQESPTASTDVQGETSPTTADDYQITPSIGDFDNEKQLTKSSGETDNNFQYVESTSRESIYSVAPSSIEEFDVTFYTKPNESESSSFPLTSAPQEERKENLSQSDINISLNNDNKSDFKQDETSNHINREGDINSSLNHETEENNSVYNISSPITSDHNLNEFNTLQPENSSKQSSHYSSLTDIEEVDLSTSQKPETKSDDHDDDNDDPNLAAIIQDLLYVFHELSNNEDLVEIDNDLPNQILDRLEFRDHFIRTIFDSLIKKYLVQEVAQSNRRSTLDWIEFRDILFPIITGRYTERHIRKLFDLFDTGRDGYLSLQEIAELLEVLHANDTIDLAQNIIDEYDEDHDGKLSVEELIEAIKKTEDINEHALSEETENKQWFNQSPTETQTITLEVPVINFSLNTNEKFTKEITLLGRIFKSIGANFDSKQLDSNKKNLSIQITNEFLYNNINISRDDLEDFIQLFVNKKQNTDVFINWMEFRDIFFPIITKGYYTKHQMKIWFEIYDTNQNGIITQDEILSLLHLLQIQNFEEIIDKLFEITVNQDSWRFDELIFVFDTVDETASHLLTNNEQITSFDIDWLSKNIF